MRAASRGMDIDGVSARSAGADVPPALLHSLLDDLLKHDLPTAPHVVARLFRELHGDLPTIREVAAHLTPPQRFGLRALPAPLPLVPPIANEFAGLQLSEADRDLLLAVALSLHDRLERILRFSERSSAELAASPAAEHLILHAGSCRLADPRLGIWLRETTAPMVQVGVHERLSVIARDLNDEVSADWHWARSSLHGVPATAAVLTRIARELNEAGQADRALLLAGEAAEHAFGIDRDEARLVAGMAALGAGYAAEASDWLGSLFPDGAETFRLQALGGLVVARAHLHGAVPDFAPGAVRPSTDDLADWYSWTRASAFAAVLCAERGDRRRMREWLGALREGCSRTGAERELRDPVVSLCWLLVGDEDTEPVEGTGPLSGAILGGLRAAVDGDIEGGLRILAGERDVDGPRADPFVAGFEHSPVVVAYRDVATALLHVWRGDLGAARACLVEASERGPITMPFAGLGVTLARRLDLAVQGRVGPFARSLTAAQPPAAREDQLIDRSLEAHLRGAFAESAELFALAAARDGASPLTALDFDEIAPADGAPRTVRTVEPPELAAARALRAVLRTADGGATADRARVQEEVRSIRSPFSRARLEAMLGSRALIRGEHSAGRRHLETASALFEEAGAAAWAAAVGRRLEGLRQDADGASTDVDPLESCRRAWEAHLTLRELEVAMLVVGGATNREIADALTVSVRTVEVHVGRLLSKFEVRTRVELTALAHRTNQYV